MKIVIALATVALLGGCASFSKDSRAPASASALAPAIVVSTIPIVQQTIELKVKMDQCSYDNYEDKCTVYVSNVANLPVGGRIVRAPDELNKDVKVVISEVPWDWADTGTIQQMTVQLLHRGTRSGDDAFKSALKEGLPIQMVYQGPQLK